MPEQSLTRRAVLLGTTGIATLLTGCGSTPTLGASPAPTRSIVPKARIVAAEKRLVALQDEFDGRLGIFAVDTGNRTTIGHCADDRFLMCSTHKVLTAAAVLHANQQRPGLLATRIHYSTAQAKASGYAPITSNHVQTGMTVDELCDAALTHSDNLADLLLMRAVGGPAAVTGYARTLEDRVTSLDRYEPALNTSAPGDRRDTSTPTQLAADLQALILGRALAPADRERLTGWMRANTTGGQLIRAGVPDGWQVADKTGSGDHSEENDIAVVWPPHRSPLVIAAFTAPADPHAGTTKGKQVIAAAAKIATDTLTLRS